MLKDEDHIQQLLKSMSLNEKIGQMAQVDINQLCEDNPNEPGTKRLSEEKVRTVIGEHATGSVLNYIQSGRPLTPTEMRKAAIYIQAVAKNYSRPPVIWGLDSVHGANYVHGAVTTPQPINLAATFNKTVAYAAGKLSAKDTRAVGINWLFAPLMGIAIEPKWARVYETFGEDPFLVSEMGAQFIAGIQEKDTHAGNSTPSIAAACAKHFVGYSASHTGNDRAPSWIPTRHLYQYFLPPWKKAIREQNVLTIMESYTEVDGVPNVANPNTLRYLLRQQLGFDGVLVTDYAEIRNLDQFHHITSSPEQSVVHSLREGSVDMSMIPDSEARFRESVNQGIANGTLVEDRITQSAERVLRLKAKLNMFHEEITMDNSELATIGQPQDIQDALDMAEQSIVLVKNEQNTLPLNVGESPSILLTGPTIHSLVYQSGGWTGEWQGVPVWDADKYFTNGSTVLDAMKSKFSNAKYTCGVDILGHECEDPLNDEPDPGTGNGVLDQMNGVYGKFKNWAGLGPEEPPSSMEKAAALATTADIVFIGIGEEAYAEKPGDLPDHSLDLPAGQYELVSLVKQSTNAKVVVVYFGGRPRLLRQIVDFADAIIIGFLPGPMAGQAIANIASGAANPSGKLPITYPMYEDGGGLPYFRTISDICTKQDDSNPLPHYEFAPCPVQWPFGFGLSYTVFQYSLLPPSTKRLQYTPIGNLNSREPLKVSAKVKNKGAVAGAETVFFFTFDESRSTTPEYKRLRAFEKVYLEPGAETTVTVSIRIEDLKFVGPHDDTHLILEDGLRFRVGIGAMTDCREGDKDSVLCSDVVTIDAGDDYIGACESACELWASSGCSEHLSLSHQKCWNLCTSISKKNAQYLGEGEDGWGWNYVHCLESIVWGFQELQSFDKNTQCGKMTSLCRNIFTTEGNDSFGHGPNVPKAGSLAPDRSAVVIALCAGLLASFLVVYALRGGFSKHRGGGSVQFTRVSNEDALTA
ncbi:Lysosomal beta glucosidase [Seminavis robusta]|uniref:beta-glucosidase n=1 Tax=Seminavis robusta TaxID=568900 RepID=A0A9N8HML7_9STRA|nr:Lysosomal beta glucosidase [Seminavis robusta]|eukprot:Sro756_g197720.1 Lysosomal beta glucosidase (977) ;mRNA; r:10934-14217